MTGFQIQGWCPGALRPMMSGDGLVVRVRPMGGRLTQTQATGIATAAARHGNGLIDLSARGNVQLRGVTPDSHPALIADLRALDLIDANALAEARRNILVTPFATPETDALAANFAHALQDAPVLPGKFGFVLDCGAAPIMAAIAGDIRLERTTNGTLILRADGSALGQPTTPETAAQDAIALAHWFAHSGGITDGRGRMAALLAKGHTPPNATLHPALTAATPTPGLYPQGALVGFEFGQIHADTLSALAQLGPLRVTPWRMLLIEGATTLPAVPGLILTADTPILRVEACTGAPACLQAHRPVRALARALAAQVPQGKRLHVSGCAKGCNHPGPADLTLVATAHGFDVIQNGRASDPPQISALPEDRIDLKGLF